MRRAQHCALAVIRCVRRCSSNFTFQAFTNCHTPTPITTAPAIPTAHGPKSAIARAAQARIPPRETP